MSMNATNINKYLLEGDSLTPLAIAEALAERDKLQRQRDALLTAAKAFMSDPHADLCSYVNLDFVRAAIEEAEK